jgi:hypothetical protein
VLEAGEAAGDGDVVGGEAEQAWALVEEGDAVVAPHAQQGPHATGLVVVVDVQ